MVEAKQVQEKSFTERKYPFIMADRVPVKTFDAFYKLAKDEFCLDYGMTIKHLMDFYQGIIPVGNEHLELEIEQLKIEIEKIKQQIKKPVVEEKKKRVMLDGTEI